MPRNIYHDTPVVECHEIFQVPVAWKPTTPPEDRRQLRCELLLEEVLEFIEASGFDVSFAETHERGYKFIPRAEGPQIIEAADALADITYVADGASLEWGIPLRECVYEVHRSNMTKLDANGLPIFRADGKYLKGPFYEKPQIADILARHQGLFHG